MELMTVALINAAVLGTPIVIGISWWIWFRRDRTLSPRWRVHVLLTSLIAISVNALMFYAWFAHARIVENATATSDLRNTIANLELRNTLGNYVALPPRHTGASWSNRRLGAQRALCLRSRRLWDSSFGLVSLFCDTSQLIAPRNSSRDVTSDSSISRWPTCSRNTTVQRLAEVPGRFPHPSISPPGRRLSRQ